MDGSVLARMVGRAGDRGPDPAVVRGAWDRAIARAGRSFAGLDPSVRSASAASRLDRDAALDGTEGRGLLAVLDPASGAKGDGRGALWACGRLIDALIEVQTQGTVAAQPGADRALTRIDVALSRDFLGLVLTAAAREAATPGLAVPALRFAGDAAGPRAVALALDGPAYDRVTLQLSLGGGRREATLVVIVPSTDARDRATAPRVGPRLLAAMPEVEVEIPAILARLRLPLDRLERLAIGSEVPLGVVSLDDLWLEDGCGRRIAQGRLGRMGPDRAVRLAAVQAGQSDPAPPGRSTSGPATPGPATPAQVDAAASSPGRAERPATDPAPAPDPGDAARPGPGQAPPGDAATDATGARTPGAVAKGADAGALL